MGLYFGLALGLSRPTDDVAGFSLGRGFGAPQDVAQRSFEVIRPGGRIAFIASGATGLESPHEDITSLRPRVARDRPHLERIVELVQAGALHAPEMTHYALADAELAHRVSENRHLRGKLVFDVQ